MPRRIHPAWAAGLISAAALAGLIALAVGRPGERGTLVVYCAASLRGPMEATATDYRRERGREVAFRFGGSGTLLASLKLREAGADLFLPADDDYLRAAEAAGLVHTSHPLGRMVAVALVQPDNPKKIARLGDLIRPGVRLAQADPDAAAIGRLTRGRLEPVRLWQGLDEQTRAAGSSYHSTVNEAANAVAAGAADAAVVWDTVARLYPGHPAVRVPELEEVTADVAIAVLSESADSAASLDFARYAAAPEGGLRHFRAAGFAPAAQRDGTGMGP